MAKEKVTTEVLDSTGVNKVEVSLEQRVWDMALQFNANQIASMLAIPVQEIKEILEKK